MGGGSRLGGAGNGKFCLKSVDYWTSKSRGPGDSHINESRAQGRSWDWRFKFGRHQPIDCIKAIGLDVDITTPIF